MSNLTTDVHQRLENIRMVLHSFKVEQEHLILKFNDEYKFKLNRPANIPVHSNSLMSNNPQFQFFHNKPGFIQPPSSSNNATDSQNTDNVAIFTKILNLDAIIMPMGKDLFSNQRLWPQALNANYRDGIAKTGNIESHGSLWKLVSRKDSSSGQRILLQSSEIGEEPKYLSPRLDLVDLKADAAVWNVKLQELPRDTDEYNNFYSNDCTKGVAVTFELVGGIPAEAEPGEYPREGSFLCCSFSKLSSSSELLILSRAEIEHPEGGDEFQSFSHVWEICPENWINDDLEFLDRYLS